MRIIVRIMRILSPIDSLITPTKQQILSAAYGQPEKWWYLRELAQRVKKTPSSIQRELSMFAANGLLETKRDGNRLYFKAATDTPIFAPLRDLLNKTVGPLTALREAIEPFASDIAFAFVYGSVAKGKERANSDVDLLIVGDVRLMELVRVLKPLEQDFGREFNPKCYAAAEFVSKFRNGNHFLNSVIRVPKIFLIGGENDIGRLVGEPLDN